jgi:MFS family permease
VQHLSAYPHTSRLITLSRGISPRLVGLIFGIGPLLGVLGSVLGDGLGDKIDRRTGFLLVVIGMSYLWL